MGSAPFVVVVDVNVLFPLTLRDTVSRDLVPLPDGVEAQSADLRNPTVSLEMLIEKFGRVVPEFAHAVRQHRSPSRVRHRG